jgi:uracil-DNA glycosylase family 4
MADPWTAKWKHEELGKLSQKWAACDACPLHETRQNVVFGVGNPGADYMVVGEAPGAEEDKEGVPFCGDSGSLLRALFVTSGIDPSDVFVTNLIGCRPPNNRDPAPTEKKACASRLHDIIYLVDPLVIIAVGKQALNALVRGSWSIENEQGRLFSSPSLDMKNPKEANSAEIPGKIFPITNEEKIVQHLEYDVIPILHPSYILRTDNWNGTTFEIGGLAHRTVKHLARAKELVERVRRARTLYQQILEGGRECR